jgi:DNA-binding NarL/FixJ family response regulator
MTETNPTTMPLQVAIVEDDEALRRTMTDILRRAPGCECNGAYASAEEALREIPQHPPDVLLMDIDLPGMNGVECVRRLANLVPETQILMLTVFKDADSIFDALSAGAVGYLVKPVRATQLVDAIHDVYGGGAPMTSSIARKVVQVFQRSRPAVREVENLSPREQEVLELLAQGYLYKEIADRMGVAYATIRTHIERIYQKLHVRSRSQAVARYLKHDAE